MFEFATSAYFIALALAYGLPWIFRRLGKGLRAGWATLALFTAIGFYGLACKNVPDDAIRVDILFVPALIFGAFVQIAVINKISGRM
ncbi:MAG: hypothetical protein ACO1RT_09335 [Planctomycetaceae bacterium]